MVAGIDLAHLDKVLNVAERSVGRQATNRHRLDCVKSLLMA